VIVPKPAWDAGSTATHTSSNGGTSDHPDCPAKDRCRSE